LDDLRLPGTLRDLGSVWAHLPRQGGAVTKKKNYRERPGPKLSAHDRVRVQLADDLRHAEKLGPYTALKKAMVLHPRGLPSPLPEALAKVPRGATRFSSYLSADERATLNLEANRLNKALTSKTRDTWVCDTSSIPGSPSYEPPE